jgi:hypothetical protein
LLTLCPSFSYFHQAKVWNQAIQSEPDAKQWEQWEWKGSFHQSEPQGAALFLLLQIRTPPHLSCCLVAATAAASATFMQLCTNIATPYTSQQHIRSCTDVNGNCANRRSQLTTAVAGHEKVDGLRHPQEDRAFPKHAVLLMGMLGRMQGLGVLAMLRIPPVG